jgi:hypothetical protein
MESLDPIKAYECMAISTPTVATPVPGFREYREALNVVERGAFAERVEAVLEGNYRVGKRVEPMRWDERAASFEAALCRANAASGAYRHE